MADKQQPRGGSPAAPHSRTGVTVLAAAGAMVAFAANSVLCRLALADGAVDAATFTTIRLVAGAIVLLVVAFLTGRGRRRGSGDWISSAMLFAYAICFSLAYVDLGIAVGALILFGTVQFTLILAGIATGERPQPLQWLGFAGACGGFVYLVSPGLEAPSPAGAALMAVSGLAWGVYTLRGRRVADPIASTTDNFVRSVPFVLVVSALMLRGAEATARGVILAVVSGGLTSGLGYVLWYVALRGLTATRAAVVQVTVPVIAALGGVVFMSEAVTPRLVVATAAILGGVAVVLAGREA